MATPILQSLLLADHVYRDQATGKYIICGVFSTIFFTSHPSSESAEPGQSPGGRGNVAAGAGAGAALDGGAGDAGQSGPPAHKPLSIQNLIQAGSPYVYFSITELTGRKRFEVRYVELNDNRVLLQAEVPIECDDPLKTIEVSMPLPRLPLVALEERSYALEVLCEGQLLGSHRVLARMTPGTAPPQ